MSSYRFCRTDDVSLLVDALNRCRSPHFPGEPAMTPSTFKRSIRDLQVWCSSCMVAFAGSDPIGVLIGAKRPSSTLIHKIAVHPDHCRQGHGRHLLTSLSSKLAILGPPRMVAEVPANLAAACALFNSSGYVQEALLTDYVLDQTDGRKSPGLYTIPVTVDDLGANGLLENAHPQLCWERAVETLNARKDDIAGLAVASDERIEACLLYVERPPGFARGSQRELRRDLAGALAEAGSVHEAEILSLRSFVEDGGARLAHLLSEVRARGMRTFWFPKVHPAEVSQALLETLGFRAAGAHLVYGARARSA